MASMAAPRTPTPPSESPVELERLRRSVRSKLFGTPEDPVRIGRFRVLRRIGAGGMGLVYLAHDDALERKVAIKLLRPELGSGQAGPRRLEREAKALARLSHPNVVAVHDVGQHDDQLFIAMEYVEGDTLAGWLRRTEPSLEEILRVFIEAARGLQAAHDVGLIHRDFKPENVLVGKDGRPRVLDFGLARPPDPLDADTEPPTIPRDADPTATTLTRAGFLVGTPAYMAPEQHLGHPADARSDQFAFCVSLFEATHGARPFLGDDLRALSLAIVGGRVSIPDGIQVPMWIEQVIGRGLSVDRERRYENMNAVVRAIEEGARKAGEQAALPPARAEEPSSSTAAAGPAAGPSLHTREIEGFLRGEVPDPAPSSGRPGLSPEELAAAAAEAGLSPEDLDLGTRVPARREPEPGALVRTNGSGLSVTTTLHRSVRAPMNADTAQVIVSELERGGRKGQAQWLGRSLVWAVDDLEVRIDPEGAGTRLTLVQRFERRAASRRNWSIIAGSIAGLIFGAIVGEEILGLADGFIPLMVFGSAGAGGVIASRLARRHHNALVEAERPRLADYADRLAALAEAQIE